jgi:hypothetical protein
VLLIGAILSAFFVDNDVLRPEGMTVEPEAHVSCTVSAPQLQPAPPRLVRRPIRG